MVSTRDKWINIFDIPDTSKHKNGFTIYKIISMLYPESCPDAVTKVTVWKRFNDFKRLHKELKILHKKMNIKTKYPSLPTSLFKRFDKETIQERKLSILCFLEYIGNTPQLFSSKEFVKFLETSHTPKEHLSSNINLIRSELNLPEDPEVCTSLSTNSDDDRTISDSDSVTTTGSLSHFIQLDNSFPEHSRLKTKQLVSSNSVSSGTFSKNSEYLSANAMFDSMSLLDGQIYPTPPNTPGSSMAEENIQYIIDASMHIKLAMELETDKKYEEAFTAYKTAVDILIKYGKEDKNYDRKQIIRYKTEKYLLRAEKIYEMYLAPEVKNLQVTIETMEEASASRPVFDLYKFKVVKIIASGMLVLNTESQQLFYIKVIHKTMQFLNENLILPERVPYMVKLINHYNCENALFLVLEYNSGTRLRDYLKTEITNETGSFSFKDDSVYKHVEDLSEEEFDEPSFSELINDYANSRIKKPVSGTKEESSDNDFVKINAEDLLGKNVAKNLMDEPLTEKCNVEDLLSESQRLIFNVNEALTDKVSTNVKKETKSDKESSQNTSREVLKSEKENFELTYDLILPEERVVQWAAQLLVALEKLHALGVVCRDLEIKNLLVDDNGNLVLTYMCNAKDLCDLYSNGINYDLAPEVYSFNKITVATDWWNYGSILYELLVGAPFSNIHPIGLTSFAHLKIPKYVSLQAKSLLKQLLVYEPQDRLGNGPNGAEHIKSHPFFRSVRWESLISAFH